MKKKKTQQNGNPFYNEEFMTEYLVLAQGWITGYVRKRNSVRVH